MPNTLAGFLLFSGLIIFVATFLNGTLKVKDVEFSMRGSGGKTTLRVLGISFMLLGLSLFGLRMYLNHEGCSMAKGNLPSECYIDRGLAMEHPEPIPEPEKVPDEDPIPAEKPETE